MTKKTAKPVPPNATDPEGSKIAGKIIVALVPFSMVLAYFGMQTMGLMFQDGVLVPFVITSAIAIAMTMGFVWFLSRSEDNPSLQKMILAFFMTLLVMMALVVFKLNGLF